MRRPKSFRPALELLEDRQAPAVLTVNTALDNTTSDGSLTLREAIQTVNGALGRALSAAEATQVVGSLGTNDTIQFSLPAGPQTITLTGGALSLTKAATINGPGAGNLTIDGNNADRVFIVGRIWSRNLSLVAAINNLTISHGSALAGSNNYGAGLLNFGTLTVSNTTFEDNAAGSSGGGGLYNVGSLALTACIFTGNSANGTSTTSSSGGGIYNNSQGLLTVTNCTFLANAANGTGSGRSSGAGIASSGTLTITGSSFSNNVSTSNGGGINNSAGSITISGTTFANNSATSGGGGLDNNGTLTMSNCVFTGNSAGTEGGAIDLDSGGSSLMSNTTFVGNTAGSRGGAINTTGALQVVNCTITGNRVLSSLSSGGGGLRLDYPAILRNTIVAGNFRSAAPSTTPSDLGGSADLTSAFNLIGVGGAAGLTNGVNGNQVGVSNPGLGILANNGGPTLTVLPLLGSPARDAGANAYVNTGVTDQRGFTRIAYGTVDIGAVEIQISAAPPGAQAVNQDVASAIDLGTFADANSSGGPWNVDVNWGDGSAPDSFATSTPGALGSLIHTYQAQGTATVTVTVTDVNHDSTQASFQVSISAGNGASTFTVTDFPSPITAGVPGTITVTARDVFGSIAVGYTGTVHFTSSDSQAGLPANYTFDNADNGTHTFSVTLKTAGSQSLTITDVQAASITGTQAGIAVYAAAASSLVTENYPASTTAGAAGSFTVKAKDAFGNIAGSSIPPRPDHVVIVVEENHSFDQIIGNLAEAPYINSLAQAGALFTNAYGITHPSQPNYLAMFSGSTQGVTDSGDYFFNAPNLANSLIDHGYSFGGYSEDLPYVGYTGPDVGAYARRHSPWVSFTNVPAETNMPFTSFPTDYSQLPTVSFVIPNINHDMHDNNGTISEADAWLQDKLSGYVQWAQTHNSLLIVTWDEDDDSAGNHIPMLFVGPMMQAGSHGQTINHYNVLRALEDMYGLPYLGEDAAVQPITGAFAGSTYTGTVHFTSSDSQAALPADYTFTSADGGVHTFNATFKTVGSHSLTATDTLTPSMTGTQSGINVSPGAAASFVVAGYPSPITAGVPGAFSVTARDAFANVATTYTGTVHFTSSDSQALLPADYAFASGDNGVHNFSATMMTPGTQSLSVADSASPAVTGSQTGITVNTPTGALLTVNSLADGNTADGSFTLREALMLVNGTLGRVLTSLEQAQVNGVVGFNDTIQFSLLNGPQSITLTGGALPITRAVTINAPVSTNLTIRGNNADRVFVVGQIFTRNLSLVVTINGLTISTGNQTYGGGLVNFGTLTLNGTTFANNSAGTSGGGGIYNVGALTLNNCTFTGNSANGTSSVSSSGGAIYNNSQGLLTVNNCSFTGNSALGSGSGASSGGAIGGSGAVSILACTFSGNTATSSGGAINTGGSLTVVNSTFSNNTSGATGGGIRSNGTLNLSGSTFTGNSSNSEGGGLTSSDSQLTLTNCTFTNNTGSRGGGIAIKSTAGAVTIRNTTITANRARSSSTGSGGGLRADVPVTLLNTIVAGNFRKPAPSTTADDIGGALLAASSFNLFGIGGSGGLINGVNNNQVGVSNPGLGALADNGGPTQTIALLPGSLAIDRGGNAYIPAGETDQRGLTRIVNGTADIGAFEVQASSPISQPLMSSSTSAGSGNPGPARLAMDAFFDPWSELDIFGRPKRK